jgi:hypothetical protein
MRQQELKHEERSRLQSEEMRRQSELICHQSEEMREMKESLKSLTAGKTFIIIIYLCALSKVVSPLFGFLPGIFGANSLVWQASQDNLSNIFNFFLITAATSVACRLLSIICEEATWS